MKSMQQFYRALLLTALIFKVELLAILKAVLNRWDPTGE